MNRLKKLFANPHSSFTINLLAYWNKRIFPDDKSAPSFQYQTLLVNDQQREYDTLLNDVELASVNSPGPDSVEDTENLTYKAHKMDHHTRLSTCDSRSDALESGEGYGSDDGEQELDSIGGEEDECDMYASRQGEQAEKAHHPVLMPIIEQMIIHNTPATQV